MHIVIAATGVVWVVARQFAGRFVPTRRSLVLPLVLVAVGVGQAGRDGRPVRPSRRGAGERATLAR